MTRIVACGGRQAAFEHFQASISRGTRATLLADSEAPVEGSNPWDHVRSREGDGWERPHGATADDLHLMVQLMESWLLADREALARFFGPGFRAGALPKNPDLEAIPKQDVIAGLLAASKPSRKGTYGKGRHSFDLLGRIDPETLASASPWARRFLDHMRGR